MKKTVLASLVSVFALVLAIYSVITWWSGDRIEEGSRTAIETLNERLANAGMGAVTIKEIEYKRGIFSSQAAYSISFASPSSDAKPADLTIHSQIDHGPLPLRSLLRGQFAPHLAAIRHSLAITPLTEKLFEYAKGRAFIEGATRVDLNGDVHAEWAALPLDFVHNGVHTVLGGATIKLDAGSNRKTWLTDITIPTLDITDTSTTVSLRGVRSRHTSQESPSQTLISQRSVSLDQLLLKHAGLPTLTFNDWQNRITFNEKESMLDGTITYDVGKLSMGQLDMGKVSLFASFDHLNSEAIHSLVTAVGNLLVRSANQAPDSELVTNSDVKAFWQQVENLLKDKPALHLSPFSVKSQTGEGTLEIHLAMAPVEVKPSGVGLSHNPLDAFHASLSLSRTLAIQVWSEVKRREASTDTKLEQTAEKEVNTALFLASMAKLVKVSGDQLNTSLTLDQNVFKLNGNALSSDGFLTWLASIVPQGWLSNDSPAAQTEPDDARSKDHFDPQALIDLLKSQGSNFEQTKNEQGDPVIQVAPGSTGAAKIEFVFVGCGTDPACEDVLLRATYARQKNLAIQTVTDWNEDHRLAKAQVNPLQEPVLEMDISTYGGLSKDSVQSIMTDFLGLVQDFATELNPASNH